ncbi:hypothetical protein B0A55_10202 [Friedmanniomyces simplex]|uniref:Heat shock protein 70 n=2 Tax=Friedmanniomyces simplex TaxID=329884 RepID=A0A4U0WJF9_9PEZI|nr:hypothetical protein B0A55_10202 [Friedmanniomyces simplex]
MDVSTATTILQLVLMVVWACLNLPMKRKIFLQVIFSERYLLEIASAASLAFAPGLLDAVQSATPPSVEWFKRLPSNASRCWAVYALVLEKLDAVTMIYIGSGTNARGLSQRWGVYDRLSWTQLPRHVTTALRDGYTITHKGTLCWAPIPSADNLPRFRLLFLALETAFACLFWAFKSRRSSHHLLSCCPWALSSFTYAGLCSHSALEDATATGLDLTAKQLNDMRTQSKEKTREYMAKYHRAERERSPERIRALNAEAGARYRRTAKGKAKSQRAIAKGKASMKWKRTFTTVADNQQTVQFPVYQGEASAPELEHMATVLTFLQRVNCEDNTSLGEFTLAPIPAMKAGDAVLEVVFEVDVNGILKVTATEKTSGRSANITISNSVGKLSSGEIEKMVEEAAKFKGVDDAFSKKFEARQQLESYISRVEEIVSDPTMSMKLKRGQKEKIESALSDAMAQLEIEDAGSDDLRKKELALKRVVTKAMSTR